MVPNQSNSIVVMPCANRPEFAAHALRRLGEARDLPEVRVYMDQVPEKINDMIYVFEKYAPKNAKLTIQPPHVVAHSGCWNITQSIKAGYDTGADFVYLVEEDVMVKPDFFEWTASAFTEGVVATCGRRDKFYFKLMPFVYTNPGACLSRPLLDKVMPHINNEYYAGTQPYIEKHIGPLYGGSSLDDGLIRVVLRENGWLDKVVFPPEGENHCFHQGFRIYRHNLDIFACHGTIQEKIDNFERISKLLEAGSPPHLRYAPDFEIYR